MLGGFSLRGVGGFGFDDKDRRESSNFCHYGIADSGVNKAFGLVVAAAKLGFLRNGLVERIILSGELVPAVA